jgi:hypothetical protein
MILLCGMWHVAWRSVAFGEVGQRVKSSSGDGEGAGAGLARPSLLYKCKIKCKFPPGPVTVAPWCP